MGQVRRWDFEAQYTTGFSLAVGVGDWPSRVGSLGIDLNLVSFPPGYPPFLRASAFGLPFKDRTFDSVLIPDSLEHMFYPEKALAEAARVARDRIIITTPIDYRFPPGQHVAEALAADDTPEAKVAFAQWVAQATNEGRRVEFLPEEVLVHGPTINTWSRDWLQRMIDAIGWRVAIWEEYLEHWWTEWHIVLEPCS